VSRWYRDLPTHEVVAERDPTAPPDPAAPDGRPDRRRALAPAERIAAWRPGPDRTTAALAGGVLLLLGTTGGRWVSSRTLARPGGGERFDRRDGQARRLRRPDGAELHVEVYGPAGGPTVVATHGWGVDSTEWFYLKRALADRCRLVVWDLPGNGLSSRAPGGDYSVERFAHDLDAVITAAGGGPVTLVGHSVGGMIALTYCRLYPQALGGRVAGLILAHTTYTNPVKTARWAGVYTALQKPVLEPLLHLTVWLSPLVWVMNWLSYQNGSAHRSARRQSFAGSQTRDQLDYLARFYAKSSPAVQARGMLGMLRYDATGVLGSVDVPALVVAGDRDPQTVVQAHRDMARALPAARLVNLAPGRHQAHFERHDQFRAAVVEFLASAEVPGEKAVAPTL
jgi:pimeloyl-ACP methyl ester carboxylesterase